MFKKITMLLALAVLILSFTGCAQITYHVTLNNNGTADVEYEMYADKSSISMIMGSGEEDAEPFSENRISAEANGFTVTPVETEKTIGFKANAENVELNIQELIQKLDMGASGKGDVTVKKGLFLNTYTVNANVDTTNILDENKQLQKMLAALNIQGLIQKTNPDSEENMLVVKPVYENEQLQKILTALNNSINVKLIFTAPSEIVSENGTASYDGKTYEYKIEMGKDNTISFSYTTLNIMSIIFMVVVLITVLFLFFRIRSKNRISNESSADKPTN